MEHLGEVPAVSRHDLGVPGGVEPRAGLVVADDVLEAGQLVRDRAHVAAALHVVLAAQGVHAAAITADVAGEEREIYEGHNIIDSVVMLGDAERPADDGALRFGICVRRPADDFRGNAGFTFRALQGIVFNALAIGAESARGVVDKPPAGETGNDDLPTHGIRERDVGTHIQAQPHVGPPRRGRASRVNNKHPRAVAQAFQHAMKEDGVRLPRVGTP